MNHHSAMPLISVIMPVYNREAFVGEAIESILHQTYENFELIIADDGSTDGSAAIVREYAGSDQRIKPFFWPHCGLPATLNKTISSLTSEFIAFADSDDIALRYRLETQLKSIQDNKLDICGSSVIEIIRNNIHHTGKDDHVVYMPESHDVITRELLFWTPIWRSTLMLKTPVCKQHLFDETMECTDFEWPYRIALKCKIGNVSHILVRMHRHENNISKLYHNDHKIIATKSRFKYFYELFPRTSLSDFMAFVHMADKEPMNSLWELERAGQWLVELSDYPDDDLQKRMAKRWQETCERSESLGAQDVDDIRKRYMEKLTEIRRKTGKNIIRQRDIHD